MSDSMFTITVRLDARSIQLEIPRTEEEIYREAAKELNEIIAFYKKKYTEADIELILLMSAYHLSVKKNTERHRQNILPFIEKIAEWNKQLDEHIKEELTNK